MNKQEFILSLNEKLNGLPKDDIKEHLNFYSEMIEDRMEDGISEEEAVAAAGNIDEIAEQIIKEIPLAKIAKEKIKSKRRLKVWEIVLISVGSPIWFSLLISLFAVIFSIYISLWAIIVSLWAVFGSFIGCALGGFILGTGFFVSGNVPLGFAFFGAGLFLSGFSILAFFGCKAATKGILLLTKKCAFWIKNCFIRKEKQND